MARCGGGLYQWTGTLTRQQDGAPSHTARVHYLQQWPFRGLAPAGDAVPFFQPTLILIMVILPFY